MEYDQWCEEASNQQSRVFNSRANKLPSPDVKVVIFGAGFIYKDADRPTESSRLVLYAEETVHVMQRVYIDLYSIPRYTTIGQRLLELLRKLFKEARTA